MNLIHVTLNMETGGGGIETLLLNLAQETNHRLFKNHLCCLDSGGGLLERIDRSRIECIVTGRRPGFDWRLIIRLSKLFAEKKIHIVHTHNQAAHFYAGIAAKLSRVPAVITTEHSRHNTERLKRRQIEKKMLSKITDKWIVVSEELAQQASALDGVNKEKLAVVRNGVNFDQFSVKGKKDLIAGEQLKKDLGIPYDAFVFIMVARLHPIKNHKLFIESFSGIVQKLENAHAIFVGDGECKDALIKQSKELSVHNKIHFLGFREDIAQLLRISNVFVLCSKSEGLPVSLLEACAANVPILITKNSNRAGFIIDGENGHVVDDNMSDLSRGIHKMIADYEAAIVMSEKSAKLVNRHYSLRAMTNQYEQIYIDLLRKKGVKV